MSTAECLAAYEPVISPAGLSGPAWLEEVRLRCARRVMWVRHVWSNHRYDGEDALAISHSEVDRALLPAGRLREAEEFFHREDPAASDLTGAILSLEPTPWDASWQRLCSVLGVDGPETHLLALCLAGAADPALRRVYGYLMDESAPACPTPSLAATLFDLPPFWAPEPAGALVRWHLARPLADGRDPYACSTSWEADALLLAPLLRAPNRDWSVGSTAAAVSGPDGVQLRSALVDGVAAFVRSVRGRGLGIEVEIIGPPGSGRKTAAAAVAARVAPGSDLLAVAATRIAAAPGSDLLAVAAAGIAAADDPVEATVREVRRSLLEGRALLVEGADVLPPSAWEPLGLAHLTFLSSTTELAHRPAAGAIRYSFRLKDLTRQERLGLWASLESADPPPPVSGWDLRPAEIAAAAQVLPAGEAAVSDVCRRMLLAGTPDLLTAMPVPHTWEDLVISPRTERHLREFDSQARHRPEVLDGWGLSRLTSMGRGVTALFAGPSGTGKTMAAQVLARSLGLDLYRVDLAGMVSKYIGETEKHLREVFDACERAPVLLLFDEADALFGKRSEVSDAHDRYANIEINYLLQRMETFNGTAILATNRKGDLDTAFVRRIQFTVDFFPPSPAEREHLWRLALHGACRSDGTEVTGALDWRTLGSQYDLTGAGIKSAALAAAFLARTDGTRIEMHHVQAAVRRELERHGKVMRATEGSPS